MKKIISSLILTIMVFNILFTNVCFADDPTEQTGDQTTSTQTEPLSELDEADNNSGLLGIVDGIAGILFIGVKIPAVIIVEVLSSVLTGVAKLDNDPNASQQIEGQVTPDDIIFNRVGLTNINFFDMENGGPTILQIRKNIASWYYALRTIAVAILLLVLIYIGIRIATTSVASEKAKYKEMIINWAVSFALVFILHFLIIIVIQFNNGLVSILNNASLNANNQAYKDVMQQLEHGLLTKGLIRSVASIILLFMIWGMTFAFLLSYIKRFLTVGFLILISPLITITYSIDKIGDGKSQALNTWLKEFCLNVLIQPFHGIVYLTFSSAAVDIVTNGSSSSIAALLFSIMCMKFMWDAEKIIKEIFGFRQASSLGDTVASLGAVMAVTNVAKNAAVKSTKAAGKVARKSQAGKNISKSFNNIGKNLKQGFDQTKLGQGLNKAGEKIAEPFKKIGENYNNVIKSGRESSSLTKRTIAEVMNIGKEVGISAKESVKDATALPGKAIAGTIKHSPELMAGAAVWGMAAGAGDKNALSYGIAAYDTYDMIKNGDKTILEKVDAAESSAASAADKYAKNNGKKDYKTDKKQAQALADEAKKLLKADLGALDKIVEMALGDKMKKDNVADKSYEEQCKYVQDTFEQLRNLDIASAKDNGFSEEDIRLASAIQRKDFAVALQEDLMGSYKELGYDNPKDAVEEWINDFRTGAKSVDDD